MGKGKLLFLLKRGGNIFLKLSGKSLMGEYVWETRDIYIYLPAHSDVIWDISKTIHHEFLHKTIHSALGKRYEILNEDFEEKLIDKLSGFKY